MGKWKMENGDWKWGRGGWSASAFCDRQGGDGWVIIGGMKGWTGLPVGPGTMGLAALGLARPKGAPFVELLLQQLLVGR